MKMFYFQLCLHSETSGLKILFLDALQREEFEFWGRMETWQGNPEDTGHWQSVTGAAPAVWAGLAGPSPTPPLGVLAVPTRPQPLGPKSGGL